jgi:hypothetical protein
MESSVSLARSHRVPTVLMSTLCGENMRIFPNLIPVSLNLIREIMTSLRNKFQLSYSLEEWERVTHFTWGIAAVNGVSQTQLSV